MLAPKIEFLLFNLGTECNWIPSRNIYEIVDYYGWVI